MFFFVLLCKKTTNYLLFYAGFFKLILTKLNWSLMCWCILVYMSGYVCVCEPYSTVIWVIIEIERIPAYFIRFYASSKTFIRQSKLVTYNKHNQGRSTSIKLWHTNTIKNRWSCSKVIGIQVVSSQYYTWSKSIILYPRPKN